MSTWNTSQRIWLTGATSGIDDCDNPYVRQFIRGEADGPIQMDVKML